jgi:hypothetical protein
MRLYSTWLSDPFWRLERSSAAAPRGSWLGRLVRRLIRR